VLLYFAYGSNMSSARLEARVGEVRVMGWSSVVGYRHAFNKHGADGTAKGNIVRDPAATVHGVVFEISIQQLEVLTVHEGGYRAVELRALHCGSGVEHVVRSFEAVRPVDGLEPTVEYLDHYRRGMDEHGLPDAYRALILALP
jgi:hypothetical protein